VLRSFVFRDQFGAAFQGAPVDRDHVEIGNELPQRSDDISKRQRMGCFKHGAEHHHVGGARISDVIRRLAEVSGHHVYVVARAALGQCLTVKQHPPARLNTWQKFVE